VSLAIHNAGPAIRERVQSTIFEPMVRHLGDENTTPGLGLGLYIASQIVLSHDGTLDVASTDADGTTFTLRLPRLAARTRRAGDAE